LEQIKEPQQNDLLSHSNPCLLGVIFANEQTIGIEQMIDDEGPSLPCPAMP